MIILNKILKNIHLILFFLFGLFLYYSGRMRILLGVRSMSMKLSDLYAASYVRKGVLYIDLSLIILIFLTIAITAAILKRK